MGRLDAAVARGGGLAGGEVRALGGRQIFASCKRTSAEADTATERQWTAVYASMAFVLVYGASCRC